MKTIFINTHDIVFSMHLIIDRFDFLGNKPNLKFIVIFSPYLPDLSIGVKLILELLRIISGVQFVVRDRAKLHDKI